MTFRGDLRKTSDRAQRTGGGGGGTIAVGGGIGTLVLVGLFLLLGGNPSDIGQIIGNEQQQSQPALPQGSQHPCETGDDANKYVDCRVELTGQSLDRVWSSILPQQAGIAYTKPGLTMFTNSTNTGCGRASSSTGPFYCPSDKTAYFDVSFFEQLTSLGGANAPLAQEYIVAHEFGHHIQQLESTLGLSNYNDPGEDSNAVKIELQADCYAGIWAHHAQKGPDADLEPITDQQVQDAVDTARAVGDDNIQQRSGGSVRPDTWTHGSSDQRQQAFLAGYRAGTMSACDTLERGAYQGSPAVNRSERTLLFAPPRFGVCTNRNCRCPWCANGSTTPGKTVRPQTIRKC